MRSSNSWWLIVGTLAGAPVLAAPPTPPAPTAPPTALPAPAQPADEAVADEPAAPKEPWIRLTENDKRVMSLEIASKEFRRIVGDGPTITLYGAVHIAEPRFYATLQKELDAFDLVLFEGVNGGEPVGEEQASAVDRAGSIAASLIARPDGDSAGDKEESDGLQARMARSLGLSFQLDEMDHSRPNWRNSDMSIEEIKSRVEAEGGDASQLLGMLDGSSAMAAMANLMFAMIEMIPGGSERGRLVIMHMLPEADDLLSGAMPGGEALMKVIIEDRNQRVIDDLKEALADESNERIAVIYGAGHMGDLTDRMADQLGYAPAETTWHPSMSLDLGRAGISKSEQMMTRIMIKRQVYQMKKMAKPAEAPEAAPAGQPEE